MIVNRLLKVVAFLAYDIGVVLVLLVLLEMALRIFAPQIGPQGTDKILYQDDLYYGSYGLRPNAYGESNGALVRVDALGCRETSAPIDTSKLSWLYLGDSVTMGLGVTGDSTFAGRLQSRFRNVNLLNPSMIGYGVDDYVNLLRWFVVDRGDSLKIDRVTVCWCLNDIYSEEDEVSAPGSGVRATFGSLISYIRPRLRTYMFLKTLFFDRPKSYYLYDSKFYSDSNEVNRAVSKVVMMFGECSRRNIPFEVLILPYEYELRSGVVLHDTPQQILRRKLDSLGIGSMDPMSYMRKSGIKPNAMYLYGDGIHLSNLGHRLIANFMIGEIVSGKNGRGD